MSLALGVFLVNAILEGLITVAVATSLEAIRPGWLKARASAGKPALLLLFAFATLLASAGFLIASTHPDGVEHLARLTGLVSQERRLFHAPLADYEIALSGSVWIRKAIAGLSGLLLATATCLALARWIGRWRRA